MIPLLTAEEMRRCDRYAIEVAGTPGPVLMETAGRAVAERVWADFRSAARVVVVVCGKGNNGGDGVVAARWLASRGVRVRVCLLGRRDAVSGDAAVQLEALAGCEWVEVVEDDVRALESALADASLVIDAILGTGLEAEVRGLAALAIDRILGAGVPVISVDIPSGISSDSGRICGNAIRAAATVTFGYPKRGHYLHPGRTLSGILHVADIGIPPTALAEVSPGLYRLEKDDFAGWLQRSPEAHKGSLGHVWVLGGSPGKTGAAGLAAWGALRAGAGLATVAWPAGLAADSRLPLEIMTLPLGGEDGDAGRWTGEMAETAVPAVRTAGALVVGPGMGTEAGAGKLLRELLQTQGPPAVLDADALNLLAADPELGAKRRREILLTPHPGEAARLLGAESAAAVQTDRLGAAAELAARFGAVVVLKGAGTLVTEPAGPVHLVAEGNPGMATAGTGDVLAGVIGACLARGFAPLGAAQLGAFVHAVAGDLAAARLGCEGLLASDLVADLPAALRWLTSP